MKQISFCLSVLVVFVPLYAQHSSDIDTLGRSGVPPYRDTHLSRPAIDTMFFARTLWEPYDVPTMGVQAATGVGLAAAIFLPGSSFKGDGLGRDLGLMGRSLLAAAIVPYGIYQTGSWMGGNGSYTSTLIGTLAGTGIALLPNLIKGGGDYEQSGILAMVLGIAGGVIGYHFFAPPQSMT